MNTRDYDEAIVNLNKLDTVMAVELGIADPAALNDPVDRSLSFQAGIDSYLKHCQRPRVLGGVSVKTVSRYRAVFDKCVPFFTKKGLTAWNQVKRRQLEAYAGWLDAESYAYRTEFFEVTAIKTAFNWWIEEGMLPETAKIRLPMSKNEDTDTYCYRSVEVEAMVAHCQADEQLAWLADVIVALACTGMRISELANLQWNNIDLEKNMITLRDQSRTRRARKSGTQTTKSRRDRMFPIHRDLQTILTRLGGKVHKGRVLPAARGGILRPDNVRHLLIKHVIAPLIEQFPSPEDEIGFKDGRLHSFRHFFCSKCANNGVPEQMLMNWLGHRESAMIRRYYHLHDDEAQRQMTKLDSLGDSDAT